MPHLSILQVKKTNDLPKLFLNLLLDKKISISIVFSDFIFLFGALRIYFWYFDKNKTVQFINWNKSNNNFSYGNCIDDNIFIDVIDIILLHFH